MSDPRAETSGRAQSTGDASPTWWTVCGRETRDLWVGGKALYLILIYMILLGIYSYTLAGNAEVKLLPIREMISEMVKHSIALGLFICVIVAADAFSGERERGTLETMLLTSASRRQVVLGKYVAALSAWLAALIVAIPYWVVLAKGDPVLSQGLRWGIPIGTVLALAMTGLGIFVSMWSDSNKTSMLVNLCLFLLVLLPTELSRPGIVQSAMEARKTLLYSFVNPWAAGSSFLVKTLAAQVPLAEVWYLPILCTAFAVLTLLLLFGVAAPRLRLEAGMARKLRASWERWRNAVGAPVPRPAKVRAQPGAAGAGQSALSPLHRPAPRPIERRPLPATPAAATWWVVFKKEFGDLWVGGKALHLTVAYTVVLGIYTYVTARDSTLSLIPPKEMVYELTKAAMVASVFVSLIIGADSLSGERERSTLETLLLTPTSRREIVVGKFLAAASPGPVALAITIPYMRVLSQGDDVLGPAILWGLGLGCVLTLAFTALAMFVGFWCNSNKTSLFVSLCLYVVFLLPTQLTGHAQGGTMGLLFQSVNPLAAPRFFLASILVNNWTLERAWSWLLSPVGFALLTFVLLFWYAGPALRLEAGKLRRLQLSGARAAMLIAGVLAFAAAPLMALQQQAAEPAPLVNALAMTIDAETKDVRAGTPIEYHTVITNGGTETSASMIVAMNIVNLSKTGDVVDPEDWSPQRTQYVDPLPAGQSATLSWRINAILDGNYMVYMVAIPAPTGPQATSHPITSPGIHLMVSKYTRLNPGGVLPYAIGGPVVLGLIIFFVFKRRHQEIDAGGGA
jgi:ABC-type transport system involved in multi-copper enzyme maturation permease subunit